MVGFPTILFCSAFTDNSRYVDGDRRLSDCYYNYLEVQQRSHPEEKLSQIFDRLSQVQEWQESRHIQIEEEVEGLSCTL
jgi:hypothetical protein